MSPPATPTVVYVHGAGNKPPADDLKRAWDLDLFGHDMGQRTRMAYYADLLHATPSATGADACTQEEALAALVRRARPKRPQAKRRPAMRLSCWLG